VADRTVWGVVKGNATIVSGSGFRVDHTDTGIFTILFDESFNVTPAVVVSQQFPGELPSHGGDTRDNAVVIGILNDRFRVKVGTSDGSAANRDFTFIATGI
jgi:hypothetical protein